MIRVCSFCALAVLGLVNAVPVQQQPKNGLGGYATVLWSVLEDCLDGDYNEPAMVCFKTKALTALDRALSKPTVTVVDGVVLAARAGKSLTIDQRAENVDSAALSSAKDSEEKNALLDDMLANRMDQLMSTRSIMLDAPDGQEGRKKKDKILRQALMMVVISVVAILGPLTINTIALIAVKALLFSKIALVLSGLLVFKKLSQPHQSSHGSVYDRNVVVDAQDMTYSGQSAQFQ